jgi:hypothetical protein
MGSGGDDGSGDQQAEAQRDAGEECEDATWSVLGRHVGVSLVKQVPPGVRTAELFDFADPTPWPPARGANDLPEIDRMSIRPLTAF